MNPVFVVLEKNINAVVVLYKKVINRMAKVIKRNAIKEIFFLDFII